VTLNDRAPITGLSTIDQKQADILAALTIKKPSLGTQFSLLKWSGLRVTLHQSTTYAPT
jgi:hypothetical protein